MRLFKEVIFLLLAAMLGAFAAGWCTDIFGAKATGEILKYGGLVSSGFLVAARLLTSAVAASEQLEQFDATTRENYASGLSAFKTRFHRRLAVGLTLSAGASTIGIILAEWETKNVRDQITLSGFGGAFLMASAVMVGAQLLAASWPSEFLASAAKLAREDKARLEKLSRYSNGEDFPQLPPA